MKNYISLFFLSFLLLNCKKNDNNKPEQSGCDIEKVYAANAQKLSIAAGIWGTTASMEGNCMPIVGGITTCKTCPAKRTVRIYEYTLLSQAIPQNALGGFYDSFTTKLVKEFETDDDGFYQVTVPPGKYTIVTIENGKLHASGLDGAGGLNPFEYINGLQKLNITVHYKAVF